jgi:hypothetical protein
MTTITTTTRTLVDVKADDARRVLAAIRAAAVAASTDAARPPLTCVLWDATADDGLRLVATDSYRLAVASVEQQSLSVAPDQVLLPASLVAPLLKAATPSRVRRGEGRVCLRIVADDETVTAALTVGDAETMFSARTLTGTFPDYRALGGPDGVGDQAECCVSAFNAAYLADLNAIAKALDLRLPTVRLVGVDARKPSTWDVLGDRVAVRYLLMPVAVD